MEVVKGKAPKALSIDDDPEFNAMLVHRFKQAGWSLKASATKEEFFLSLLEVKLPSLILVDLNINSDSGGDSGNSGGFEIINRLVTHHFVKCPIIVVSGNTDNSSIAHALELGARDYWTKPISKEMLQDALHQYADSAEETGFDFTHLPAVPETQRLSQFTFKAEILEVNQTGFSVVSSKLIRKKTVFRLRGPIIDQILPDTKSVLVTALSSSTFVGKDGRGNFRIETEFDENDEVVCASVKRWIAANAG